MTGCLTKSSRKTKGNRRYLPNLIKRLPCSSLSRLVWGPLWRESPWPVPPPPDRFQAPEGRAVGVSKRPISHSALGFPGRFRQNEVSHFPPFLPMSEDGYRSGAHTGKPLCPGIRPSSPCAPQPVRPESSSQSARTALAGPQGTVPAAVGRALSYWIGSSRRGQAQRGGARVSPGRSKTPGLVPSETARGAESTEARLCPWYPHRTRISDVPFACGTWPGSPSFWESRGLS